MICVTSRYVQTQQTKMQRRYYTAKQSILTSISNNNTENDMRVYACHFPHFLLLVFDGD